MIEFAFWGQNQSSFQKAKEIIKRVHNIDISYVTVMKITEYISKIVSDYNYKKALDIWNDRANIDMSIKTKKVHYIYKVMVLQLILE